MNAQVKTQPEIQHFERLNDLVQSKSSVLTHGQEPPRDGGRGQAGEHVVGAGEVCEVGQQDALAPALAPHVHMAALGLRSRRVR